MIVNYTAFTPVNYCTAYHRFAKHVQVRCSWPPTN